jgi:hypothetical protein
MDGGRVDGGGLELPGSGGRAWVERAACAGRATRVFFTDGAVSGRSWTPALAGLAYCHDCPVRSECLRDALVYGDSYGIRGGLTAQQRSGLHRAVTDLRKARGDAGNLIRAIEAGGGRLWEDNRARLARAGRAGASPGTRR